MLVIETKEERGLAYLKGHPSHIKTTEFAQKAALRSQFCFVSSIASYHLSTRNGRYNGDVPINADGWLTR
jgi:hypothetical protein